MWWQLFRGPNQVLVIIKYSELWQVHTCFGPIFYVISYVWKGDILHICVDFTQTSPFFRANLTLTTGLRLTRWYNEKMIKRYIGSRNYDRILKSLTWAKEKLGRPMVMEGLVPEHLLFFRLRFPPLTPSGSIQRPPPWPWGSFGTQSKSLRICPWPHRHSQAL